MYVCMYISKVAVIHSNFRNRKFLIGKTVVRSTTLIQGYFTIWVCMYMYVCMYRNNAIDMCIFFNFLLILLTIVWEVW